MFLLSCNSVLTLVFLVVMQLLVYLKIIPFYSNYVMSSSRVVISGLCKNVISLRLVIPLGNSEIIFCVSL